MGTVRVDLGRQHVLRSRAGPGQRDSDGPARRATRHQPTTLLSTATATKKMLAERRRSVSFSPSALGLETIRIANYTTEEIAACWYDAVELKMIKVDIKTTTLLLMNNDYLSLNINDWRCSCGLESYTQLVKHQKSNTGKMPLMPSWTSKSFKWTKVTLIQR